MLPNFHSLRYQEFVEVLTRLQQSLVAPQLDAKQVRETFLAAQQFFQQQILPLDTNDLEPSLQPKVRSLQTEMSKQLQLVGMDLMYLQAARQQKTAIARIQQISNRLRTIISYCNTLLEKA